MIVASHQHAGILDREAVEGWTTGISDRSQHILALEPPQPALIGQIRYQGLRETLTTTPGVWEGRNRQRQPVLVIEAQSRLTGWTVGTSIPKTIVNARLDRWLYAFLAFALLVLATASYFAVSLWSRVSRPLRQLAASGPALARGELNLIGATTLNEYQKYIEKDAALERRFQPVYVDEPTVAQTIMILRGLRDTLESHHKVTITDEAIIAAAELSDRYITGRFMPDKAIDLIDQAAARVKISATARPVDVQELEAEVAQIKREQDYAAARKQFDRAAELKKELEQKQKELDELLEIWKRDQASATAEVRADHVAQIVSKITGVPVTELTTEEKDKLLKLEEKLHERVIGQEEAIRAVADAVNVPVIASGGVGTLDHLAEGVTLGHASAVLAASIFHFGTFTVREAKEHMAAAGIPMRLT